MSEKNLAEVTLSLPPIFHWPKQDIWSRPTSVGQESIHFPWRLCAKSEDELNDTLLQLREFQRPHFQYHLKKGPWVLSSHWLHIYKRHRRGSITSI